MTVERLSWASGPVVREGWHHSDVLWYDGMQVLWPGFSDPLPHVLLPARDHVGRIQDGLPWADATFDYCVSMHGLMMLPEPDLIPALAELRRVTKPGGWLRVSVPDMWHAIHLLRSNQRDRFPVEAADTEEAFCRYVTQNGATRSVFTFSRLQRLIHAAGWENAEGSSWRATWSTHDGITELDSRPNESLYMEAVNSP